MMHSSLTSMIVTWMARASLPMLLPGTSHEDLLVLIRCLGVDIAAAPVTYFESLDDATLDALRENGDIGAIQTLAARATFVDPFQAIDLYEQAANLGSIRAALRISSLLDSLRQVAPDVFAADPRYPGQARAVSTVRGRDRQSTLPPLFLPPVHTATGVQQLRARTY